MTKEAFLEEAVRSWVEHFGESEKFENTALANKTIYLKRHLKAFRVDVKKVRALLVKVESEDTAQERAQQREGLVENNKENDGVDQTDNDRDEPDGDDEIELEEVGDASEEVDDVSEEANMDCDEDEGDEELMDYEEDEDEDLGEDDVEVEETRAEREFEVRQFLDKSDDELFRSGLDVPKYVQKSVKFKERRNKFIQTYLEEQNYQDSQEILENFSQAPPVVKDTLKQKLSHLSKQERAQRLMVKTLSDTLKRLKETPGKEARNQVQVILAAISHHR